MDGHGSLLIPDSVIVGDTSTTQGSKDNLISQHQTLNQPYHALIAKIDSTTTILTPNSRIAAVLHDLYHAAQIAQGKITWETPDILPAVSWLQRTWSHYISTTFDDTPQLLTPLQAQSLWESILQRAKEFPQLLQLAESANTAQSAWRLLKQWQIPLSHSLLTLTDDFASMQTWAMAFQTLCDENHWIDQASMPTLLTEKILQQVVELPPHLILAGMGDLPPQFQSLLMACQARGCQVEHYQPSTLTTNIQRTSMADAETEIISMARWAKAIQDMYPSASIGCVVPNLRASSRRVEQLYQQVFETVHADPASVPAKVKKTYHISASKPLADYPAIKSALTLLQLMQPVIAVETFNQILASPFVGEAEQERVKRANMDRLLRQQNVITVQLNQILQADAEQNRNALTTQCPQLAKRLNAFLAEWPQHDDLHTYAEWVNFISSALNTLGWPGERTLSSDEYQIIKRWLAMLGDFKTLDQVAPALTGVDMLNRLRQLAKKTMFQPQANDASIQILGLTEAAGVPFDYLWVCGMDDLSWPPAPKPNALLPKQLQREAGMPHSTANLELTAAMKLMDNFASTANTIIYSHALKSEAIELETSPLIRTLPSISVSDLMLAPYQSVWERIQASHHVDAIDDTVGPHIAPGTTSMGGINIIKNQAICPFKAFAEHRLQARELEKPVAGLRAKDRGNMIHQVMELTWIALKNHDTLFMMPDAELRTLIDQAIVTAIQSESNSRSAFQHYTQLERKRLMKLIWHWLQIEKLRTPFVVAANEFKADITLDQLTFSCKIDRIDTLPDGRSLIIDYKTGKHNDYKLWFGDRPEEPQLPIYALNNPGIAAIAYAQINRSESMLSGVGDDDVDIKGIKQIHDIKLAKGKSWSDQLTEWEMMLTKLAIDFVNGVATVDPKDGNKSCEFCTLQPLCRIHEEIHHAD